TAPGQLVTAAPYEYYPEVEWRDDLELGAAEIALALAQPGVPTAGLPVSDPAFYTKAAAHWAHEYIGGPNAGADTLNPYDVSALAQSELVKSDLTGLEVTTQDLLGDMEAQLESGAAHAASDIFGAAVDAAAGDAVPRALGFAVTARLFHTASGEF